jgi:hypothetical protein
MAACMVSVSVLHQIILGCSRLCKELFRVSVCQLTYERSRHRDGCYEVMNQLFNGVSINRLHHIPPYPLLSLQAALLNSMIFP